MGEMLIRLHGDGRDITVEETVDGVVSVKHIEPDSLIECFRRGIRLDSARSGLLPQLMGLLSKGAPAAQPGQQVPVAGQPPMPAAGQQAPVPPAPNPTQPPAATALPTEAARYTREQLARAGVSLMDSGKADQVQGLLAQFGAERLEALPEAQYGAFATALRGLGAKL